LRCYLEIKKATRIPTRMQAGLYSNTEDKRRKVNIKNTPLYFQRISLLMRAKDYFFFFDDFFFLAANSIFSTTVSDICIVIISWWCVMDNSTYNILRALGQEADFLYSTADTYIGDAKKDNRQHLVEIWNQMKRGKESHLQMLSEALEKEAKEEKLSK
jgi:hypothetical protein